MRFWFSRYTILPYWFGYYSDNTGYHELGLGKFCLIWERK